MRKGGIMNTSSFEHIVKIQFNALMMTVIKCTVKNRNRQFTRRSKREILFCELSNTKNLSLGQRINILVIIFLLKSWILQSKYQMRNLLLLYCSYRIKSVMLFYYAIFKAWATKKLQNYIMYHVLLFITEEVTDWRN